jgi:DNA-binding NarL/FixJ family response regulator
MSERQRRAEPAEVLVAERNPLVVSALREIFERHGDYAVYGHVRTAPELYDALSERLPDFLLLGWSLGEAEAPDVMAGMARLGLSPRVVIFADRNDPMIVSEAVRLGVHGLCFQYEDPSILFTTLSAVAKGRICIPYAELNKVADTPLSRLTQRERELLGMLGDGWTNTQIATRTGISENTVKYHLKNLYDKLEVRNRAMAVSLYAMEQRRRG